VLLAAVGAAVRARRLTLTELGRAPVGTARPKHDIKRIDWLLGNHHLAAERFELYQVLARRMVGALREPLIVIDWSDLTPNRRWQLLRAAMPIGGRCPTLYEEAHPLAHLGNPRVQQAFGEQGHGANGVDDHKQCQANLGVFGPVEHSASLLSADPGRSRRRKEAERKGQVVASWFKLTRD
jgi:hypothetical protein